MFQGPAKIPNFPKALRVHVPNHWLLRVQVVVVVVQVLGTYMMIIEYLDPWGLRDCKLEPQTS